MAVSGFLRKLESPAWLYEPVLLEQEMSSPAEYVRQDDTDDENCEAHAQRHVLKKQQRSGDG